MDTYLTLQMALLLTTISTTKFPTYPVQLYSNSEQSSLDLLALDNVNFYAELNLATREHSLKQTLQ